MEANGLILNRETVVDATIIAFLTRPLSHEEREKLEHKPSFQIDTEANSTKNNGSWHFGNKDHIGVDLSKKLIRTLSFTHDSNQLEAPYAATMKGLSEYKAYASKNLNIKYNTEEPITASWINYRNTATSAQ